MSQLHAGHRERLRKRFEKEGLDGFAPHEVLELLLFYSIPRVNTNPIAHRLIEKFGTLSAVFEASPEDLCKVKDIGPNSAALISMIPAVANRYLTDKNSVGIILDTPKKIGDYILPYFIGHTNEMLYMLCMDKKCKLINCVLLAEGSVDSVVADIRLICKTALDCKAFYIALAHNHDQGFAVPSANDIAVTRNLIKQLAPLDITLIDHIVSARDDYISMVQSGYITGL